MMFAPVSLIGYVLGFPIYALYFLAQSNEGLLLLLGIIVEFIGPIIAFVGWSIILYLIYLVFSSLLRKNSTNEPQSNKKLISFCIIAVIILSVMQFLFILNRTQQLFSPKSDGKIINVSPSVLKIGESVSVNVSGFSHDTYSYATLIKYLPDGSYYKKGTVWVGKVPENNIITFILEEKNCDSMVTKESCDSFVNLIPDNYKLRIQSPADNLILETAFVVI